MKKKKKLENCRFSQRGKRIGNLGSSVGVLLLGFDPFVVKGHVV